MKHLKIHKTPSVDADCMITALAGWADAGEAATAALRYLIRLFKAEKFAELDPEEFYDFSHIRPYTSLTKDGERRIRWPANEIYSCSLDEPGTGLLFFLGVEPSLKWRTYADTLVGLARSRGVSTVVHIGALLDAVPHTRDIQLTGTANSPEFRQTLEKLAVSPSRYQGPTGITSAVTEACTKQGLGFATMWGHAPHYLQAAPNYTVSHSLIKALSSLLHIKVPMQELEAASAKYQQEVTAALDSDSQLSDYVRKLEERYDTAEGETWEMPRPDEVVRDLERFLKERQRSSGDADSA